MLPFPQHVAARFELAEKLLRDSARSQSWTRFLSRAHTNSIYPPSVCPSDPLMREPWVVLRGPLVTRGPPPPTTRQRAQPFTAPAANPPVR